MNFLILNISLVGTLIAFFIFLLKGEKQIQLQMLSRFFAIGIFQAFVVVLLIMWTWMGNRIYFLDIIYTCLLLIPFIAIFTFSCSFPNPVLKVPVKITSVALTLATVIYCLVNLKFMANPDINPEEYRNLFSYFDAYSSMPFGTYILILAFISIAVLLLRSFFNKNMILRYKMILSAFILAVAMGLYLLVPIQTGREYALSFFYPTIVACIVFALYTVSLIDRVPSIKEIGERFAAFLMHYSFFALVIVGILCLWVFLSEFNSVITYSIGSVIIIVVFLLQAMLRKKDLEKKRQRSPFVMLNDFFGNISSDLKANEAMQALSAILTKAFYAENIEFFVETNDNELTAVYSTRDFTDVVINADEPIFSTLFEHHISVLPRHVLYNTKKFAFMKKEAEELFLACDSDLMIFVREDQRIIGIISLGRKKYSHEYSNADIHALETFYSSFFIFASFLKNKMKEEVFGIITRELEFSDQIVNSIQKNMDAIHHPSLDIGYLSLSLRNLGGDFIDFIRLTDTRHMFILGDVSGRGLNASMSMVILKSMIRTFLAETTDFKELIEKLNRFIKYNLPRGTFFAGTIMVLDITDMVLFYVNCGVPGIFAYTEAYNNVIEIQGEGKVLGFVNNVTNMLKIQRVKLNEGDVILTCTDGVTDSTALRGETYGKRRIQNLLLENKAYSAEKICQFVHEDLMRFTTKGIEDDISVITFKFLPKK